MSDQDRKPGVMRSLGAFFGEIARAVRSDPDTYDRHEARRQSPSATHSPEAGKGRIILRRTTTQVDEVELRPQDEDPRPERQ